MDIIKQLEQRISSEFILKPSMKFECKKLAEMLEDISGYFEEGEESFFLAGGAITSTITGKEVNDLDIYPKTAKAALTLIEYAEDKYIKSATEKSLYVSIEDEYDVNIILLDVFPTAEAIFKSFDFTIVMAAYDNDTEEILMHKNYLLDLAARRLQFNSNTAFPLMSLFRANKYCDRGFKISKFQYSRIALRTAQLNINSYEELEKHLGGMYGLKIKGIFGDTPFDLDNVIEVLNTVSLDAKRSDSEKDFNKTKDLLWDKFFKLAYADVSFYKHGKVILIHVSGEEFKLFNGEVPADLVCKDLPEEAYMVLYKNVKPVGDKFVSFHDNDFEYKLGNIIIPKAGYNKTLYFSTKKDLHRASYSSESTKVILKAKVFVSDYHSGEGKEIRVKACEPLEFSEPIIKSKDSKAYEGVDLFDFFKD